GAGFRRLVRRAPGRRRDLRFGLVEDRVRLTRGVGDVAVGRVERRLGRRSGRPGRVVPVGGEAAAVAVVVGGLDPLVLAGDDEPGLVVAGRLRVAHVVHPGLGVAREADAVGDVAEPVFAALLLRQDLPVVERVDEAGRAQEVGEAVGLVAPFRRGEAVVLARTDRAAVEVDLAEARPGGAALVGAVEVATVLAQRVDG